MRLRKQCWEVLLASYALNIGNSSNMSYTDAIIASMGVKRDMCCKNKWLRCIIIAAFVAGPRIELGTSGL